MKKLFLLMFMTIYLASCSSDAETFDFTVSDYEANITSTVDSMKGNSFIAIQPRKNEDEELDSIPLMDSIYVLIGKTDNDDVTDVNIVTTSSALAVYQKEVKIAFQALIKSVDPTLSVIQQMTLLDELGISWTSSMLTSSAKYEMNGISYNYIGDSEQDIIRLQATPAK